MLQREISRALTLHSAHTKLNFIFKTKLFIILGVSLSNKNWIQNTETWYASLKLYVHILHFQVITLVLSHSKAKLHSARESRKRKKYNSYKKKSSLKFSLIKRQSLLLLTLPPTPTKGLCICKTSMLPFMARQEANSKLFLFPHSSESFPDLFWEN